MADTKPRFQELSIEYGAALTDPVAAADYFLHSELVGETPGAAGDLYGGPWDLRLFLLIPEPPPVIGKIRPPRRVPNRNYGP